MREISQSFSVAYAYRVFFSRELFQTNNSCLSNFFKAMAGNKPHRVLVILDKVVSEKNPNLTRQISNYALQFKNLMSLATEPILLEGGEACKNDYQLVELLLQKIDKLGMDRHSYIMAIGGGALLDLIGFVSAIAHRGIRHLRVPTTVLSQNDSGVGVKNGVNLFQKKNFIGTFAPPAAVFNDTQFLTSLEDRDWRAGIAEAVKVSLIKDSVFFKWIERSCQKLRNRELGTMEELIFRCAELHLAHIRSEDPFESGSSRPLDFGHWAAHKLEKLSAFDLRHGEAVAVGIALDTQYSARVGMLSQTDADRVHSLLEALGLPTFDQRLLASDSVNVNPELLKGLDEFREHLGGELTIMLLSSIGAGAEVHEIDSTQITHCASHLQQRQKSHAR